MDVSSSSVSPLRQRMVEDMRMRKFEPKTQTAYLRAVRKLAAFLKASPDTATAEDLRRFQMHLVDEGVSPTTLNATISGLRIGISNAPPKPDDQTAASQDGTSAAVRSWLRRPFGTPRRSPWGSSGLDLRTRS